MNVRGVNVEMGVTATGVSVKKDVGRGAGKLCNEARLGLTVGQVWEVGDGGGIAWCGGRRGAS